MMLLSLGLILLGTGLAIAEGTFLLKFGGESSGAGRLSQPYDVAIDGSGNAWVADTEHSRVQKFNSSGEFVSQFGVEVPPRAIDLDSEGNVWVVTITTGGLNPKVREYKQNGELIRSFGELGSGNGQFGRISGIAIDPSGNVWVLDAGGTGVPRVQKFNSKGEYLAQFGKKGTGNGEFESPEAIAADSEGNILVADTGNNRVQEFNSAGEYVRKYGSEGDGNGQFTSPRGIAVDSEGRVWVTDSGNNRIQRFSSKGAYQAQCGTYGPNDLRFWEPRGLATSGSNVYVADTRNDRVQKLNTSCEFLLKFGGESSGAGRLSQPYDVAIDASGNAWVADTEHSRVQKFNSSGEFVSQFGVEVPPRAIDLDSEGNVWVVTITTGGFNPKVREYKQNGELIRSFGELGSGNGQFGRIAGIAIDPSGNVWVLDAGGTFGVPRVQKFNSKGEYLAQFGKKGTGNGEFESPEAIATDSEGNILVADTGNNRVQEFNSAGEYVRKYGEKGTGNGQLQSPRGIAVDSEGRVWVTDSGNNRIQRFSSKGAYQAQCGSYGPNDLQFWEPRGLATSGSNVYVADTKNDRVQKLSTSCTFLLKFGGESSGAGRLSQPYDVAIDASGDAWVADTEHSRVQKFNSSGEFVSQFGVETQPRAIDLDSEGNVWVVTITTGGTNPKVREYKQNGELIRSFGELGSGNGQFGRISGIAIDPSGNVWVLDAGGVFGVPRVQKFNSKGEYVAQFGKKGTGNGEFESPEAIATDSEGNLLVADTGNNRVQEFNSAGEYVRKYGEKGTGNGQFTSPRGIAVDSEGRVWVTDSGNNRIQRFSSKGAYQAQCGSYGPNDLQFWEPRGLATSGSNVYVADTKNDRVQKLSC